VSECGSGSGTVCHSQPGWRNGIRDGLKHHCPKGRVGSNPTPGTSCLSVRHAKISSMGHIRSAAIAARVLAASENGVPDIENARQHGVAIKTVRRWRRDYQRRGLPRGQVHTSVPCPRCDDAPMDESAYVELFGWYLGDGHITMAKSGVYNLHVYNDARFPLNNARLLALMRQVKPGGRPHSRRMAGAWLQRLAGNTGLACSLSTARDVNMSAS
jgi:hypothetical protein